MKVLYLSKALVVGAYQSKMEALAAQGLEVIAAVPPSWKDERGETLLERAHTEGYTLRVLPIALNGSFHAHFFPTLGRLLDEVRPALLHVDEEAYNFATLHAGWLARRRAIPFLFFSWQNLLRHYPPPFRWMERWVFRHSAHAIAGNREAEQVLRQKGYAGALTVIPQFGVDPAHFPLRPSPPPDSPPRIGYAGRFVEEKGLPLLLEALGTMQELPWECVLRGSGPARPTLQAQIARLGLGERVRIEPPVRSTEMPAFYRTLDLFVLPSLTRPNWKEQFGRVLIEAMASGAVVVGSDSGEIPHVIGDAGCVVPEGNAAALATALRPLLTERARRHALARAGRQRVLDHFTQEAIARRTASVYRSTLHP